MSKSHGMGLIPTLREGIHTAIDSLFANKVRSGLTILGVAIGVVVVMVMAAVVEGVNSSFKDIIAAAGPNTFYVMHAPMDAQIGDDSDEEESAFMTNEPLNPRWAEDLERLPEVEYAAAMADLSGNGNSAFSDGESVRISLIAVTARYLDMSGGTIIDGRYFSEVEDARRSPVAVIDASVAEDLWHGQDPLLRAVKLGHPNGRKAVFRTIGIYEAPDNLFSGLASHYVLIPFSAADKYLPFWERLVSFTIVPAAGVTLDEALDAVQGRMRQIRGLSPGEADDFGLITQDQVLDFWDRLTGVLFAVMIALSGVGLMVGGVGVIGIMMISVTERTREIGIRKALGARRRDLLLQFLVEASTLTAVGGGIGLLFGGGIAWVIQKVTIVPASVPLWAVMVALLASVLTGVGFGLYPAARGAAMDPVDALRYE
ncbi:MAG: ABC transporter permease [Gemmatimonadales bacterium]|nr:MAG: ABC transporter permease [Gemmatimonadales bacterium]